MALRKKIRELKNDVNSVRGDVNSFARTGFRALGKGESYPLPIEDPQPAYLWEVVFEGDSTSFSNIKFYAQEATIPQTQIQPIEENYIGQKIYYAGKDESPHTLQLSFWDNEDLEVYRFLQEWVDIIHEPRFGFQVNKQLYTKTAKLVLKDNSDLFVTGDFWFVNCFPTELSDISLSYENNGPIEISVTLQFDRKYAGKQKNLSGGDSISDYLELDSYVESFTGDFDSSSFNNITSNVKDFF